MSLYRPLDRPKSNAANRRQQEISKSSVLKSKAERCKAKRDSPSFDRDEPLIEIANQLMYRKIFLLLEIVAHASRLTQGGIPYKSKA